MSDERICRSKKQVLRRARHYRTKYGIEWEEAEALLVSQNHECRICGCKLVSGNRHLDHNHETGDVAGWLCARDNIALGTLGDGHDLERLRNLLRYAEETRHENYEP